MDPGRHASVVGCDGKASPKPGYRLGLVGGLLCSARVLAPPPTSPSTSFFHVADPWRILVVPIMLKWDLSGIEVEPSGRDQAVAFSRPFSFSNFLANPSIDPC